MDLKRIVKDASIHFVQFRELLIQIGQKNGVGDPWEMTRVQRRRTLDSLRKACANVIAKKPMYAALDINKQLNLLSSWTIWLLNELCRCKILMQNLPIREENLRQKTLSSIETDMGEAGKLLDEIDSHKVKVQTNLPMVSAYDIEIEMSEFSTDNASIARKDKKRRRPKCRPKTNYEFS